MLWAEIDALQLVTGSDLPGLSLKYREVVDIHVAVELGVVAVRRIGAVPPVKAPGEDAEVIDVPGKDRCSGPAMTADDGSVSSPAASGQKASPAVSFPKTTPTGGQCQIKLIRADFSDLSSESLTGKSLPGF